MNWSIWPFELESPAGCDGIERDDVLELPDLRESLAAGGLVAVVNHRTGARFRMRSILSPRERDMLLAGGLLTQTASISPSPPSGERAGRGGESHGPVSCSRRLHARRHQPL